MCGIFGVVSDRGEELDLAAARLALAHRGPDGHGLAEETLGPTRVRFGQTRLAIVDLSQAGAQPMYSRDRRWLVAFNGEIFNHAELREGLPGCPWRGHSDTETLVECLARHGFEATIGRLNGQFAMAAADLAEGICYLARDPFGIKPLYHADWGRGIAFASELRGLRAMGIRAGDLDSASVATLLALRYVPSPHTIFLGIRRLGPGHYLKLRLADAAQATAPFIHPTRERFAGSFPEAVEAYGAALQRAVERQMMSDVPVGVLLSGGVDSALVSAAALKAGRRLKTFTVGYELQGRASELEGAADTARIIGVPNFGLRLSERDLLETLPKVARQVEEPLGTTSMLSLWHLCRFAREQVTVVLTGQGGDEPLGGYRRYQSEVFRSLAGRFGLEPLCAWLARWGSPRSEGPGRFFRAMRERDRGLRFLRAYELFYEEDRKALLRAPTPDYALEAIRHWLGWLGDHPHDGTDSMMRLDTRMNLADDLLLLGDKIAMAFSLEARVPLLDLDLERLIESFPTRYRVRLGQGKIVHKALARTLLPARKTTQRKLGFPVPFEQWSRTSWKPVIEDLLLDPSGPAKSLLSSRGVERLWREHLAGTDHSRGIFTLVSLALWGQGKSWS